MKILIIGGTGHVGSFLVPMLTAQGHEVYVATRGKTAPRVDATFDGAKFITCDASNEESLQALRDYRFDTVVDFPGHGYRVWNVLRGSIGHLVACGSLWMFGNPRVTPTPEQYQGDCPFDIYAVRYRHFREMLAESGMDKTLFTGIMPPNIAGPGKIPLDTAGGRSIELHRDLMAGKPVVLPDGPEALICPCDAEDIAALFALAINHPTAAAGQLFNVGTDSVTATELVRIYGEIYGTDIPIERVPWNTYITEFNPPLGNWWHFYAHMVPDISKAYRLLGFVPRYSAKEALTRAVDWMRAEGLL